MINFHKFKKRINSGRYGFLGDIKSRLPLNNNMMEKAIVRFLNQAINQYD